jgi:hypothetical protein
MICNNCKHMIVLHAFSEGECKHCKEKITTSHIPCHEVCKTCSEKHDVCEQCNKEINGDGEVRPRSDEPSNP